MMSEEYTANVNHQEGPSRPGYRSCILALIITCNMEHAGIYNDQSNLLMASLNNTTARWIIQIRVRPHDHIISSGRLWPVLYIWCHYCQRNLIKIQPQTWFGISYDTAASLGRTRGGRFGQGNPQDWWSMLTLKWICVEQSQGIPIISRQYNCYHATCQQLRRNPCPTFTSFNLNAMNMPCCSLDYRLPQPKCSYWITILFHIWTNTILFKIWLITILQ